MKLYSYVVARDYGFAPNPFYGVCTLATCKPVIRRVASVDDWIIGTGAGSRRGRLVFAMQVGQALSFDEYWHQSVFRRKKPNLHGSKKMAYGDNIYRTKNGKWYQANSHHSLSNGAPNEKNIDNDTKTDRVLASNKFVYFGGSGPEIPRRFRNYGGTDICAVRGYKVNYPPGLVFDFLDWMESLTGRGFVGEPLEWRDTQ